MGKKSITFSLNSTDIVVFKNPRDQTQIHHLACQMLPHPNQNSYKQPMEEETKHTYWYLFIDFHPNSPEFARVCGNIFLDDLLEFRVVSISQKICKSRQILQSHLLV